MNIHIHTHKHTVYYDRICDASNASVYNVYKVCYNENIQFKFLFWLVPMCFWQDPKKYPEKTTHVLVFFFIGTCWGDVYNIYRTLCSLLDLIQIRSNGTPFMYDVETYFICIENKGPMVFVKLSDIPCLYVL